MLVHLSLENKTLFINLNGSTEWDLDSWYPFQKKTQEWDDASKSYYFCCEPEKVERWLKKRYRLVERLNAVFFERYWRVEIPVEELLTHESEKVRIEAVKHIQETL